MLQLLELMPLVIFVLVFGLKDQTVSIAGLQHSFDGIYDATAALMIATVLQVLLVWLLKRHVEKRLWWLLAAVLIFGSATLWSAYWTNKSSCLRSCTNALHLSGPPIFLL